MTANFANIENDNVWGGDYKIPWDDADFSRRMLAEHLSQDHDLASRRGEWIDRQVDWIDGVLLGGQAAKIVDLGCGPGFYCHRLGRQGHSCYGIDFGSASIDYAQQHNPADAKCDFALGDIRTCEYHGPYDLAMILFGELNVFSPAECRAILRKAYNCLAPGGRLIIEPQTAQAVENAGLAEAAEHQAECGLFSDQPYTCRMEHNWLTDQKVAVQTFTVTDTQSGQAKVYRSTTKAWSDEEIQTLLTEAGFKKVTPANNWPTNTDALKLWVAEK